MFLAMDHHLLTEGERMEGDEVVIHHVVATDRLREVVDQAMDQEEVCVGHHHQDGMAMAAACAQGRVQGRVQVPCLEDLLHLDTAMISTRKDRLCAVNSHPTEGILLQALCNPLCRSDRPSKWTHE